MADDKMLCPICRLDAAAQRKKNAETIQCRRCGKFEIADSLVGTFQQGLSAADQRLLPYLSAYIRQADDRREVVVLRTDNWQELAKAHVGTSPSHKVRKLLEWFKSRSPHLGAQVSITGELDYPLVDAVSSAELGFVLQYTLDLNYIKRNGDSFQLTVPGWEHLQPATGGIPGRCFIAMSFDPSLDDAFQSGIYLAVKKDCDFEPIRIDRVHHNEKICDKIIAEIRLSQFVVADFTFQRAGVYFEAGFAMGLGRPVIWTCREDDFDNTHFDTRQYNHIIWETPQDLREKLADRIRATITR